MQCNAGVRKTALLRFCIQVIIDQCLLPAGVANRRCLRRAREFPVPYKDCATFTCRPHQVTEQPALTAPNDHLVRSLDFIVRRLFCQRVAPAAPWAAVLRTKILFELERWRPVAAIHVIVQDAVPLALGQTRELFDARIEAHEIVAFL